MKSHKKKRSPVIIIDTVSAPLMILDEYSKKLRELMRVMDNETLIDTDQYKT